MFDFKVVFVCYVTLLITVPAYSQNQSPNAAASSKLGEYYYYKCWNQTRNLEVYNKLANDADEFMNYLQYTFGFIPEKMSIFCNNERPQLNRRIEQISKELEPCLPSQEKYLSEFLRKSFNEFTHFLCHDNAVYTNRIFSRQNSNCREALEGTFLQDMSICFGRIFRPLSGYLAKDQLCDDISVAEKCLAENLNQKCPSSKSYQNLNKEFFSFISKPCSGCVSRLSTLLLILSLVLPYLFSKK